MNPPDVSEPRDEAVEQAADLLRRACWAQQAGAFHCAPAEVFSNAADTITALRDRVTTLERERDEARAEIECKQAIDVKTWDIVRDLRIRGARLEAALTQAETTILALLVWLPYGSVQREAIRHGTDLALKQIREALEVAVSSSDTPNTTNVAD